LALKLGISSKQLLEVFIANLVRSLAKRKKYKLHRMKDQISQLTHKKEKKKKVDIFDSSSAREGLVSDRAMKEEIKKEIHFREFIPYYHDLENCY